MARRSRVAGALLLALLANCGGERERQTVPAAATEPREAGPTAVETCPGEHARWRAFAVRAHGVRLNAAVRGDGGVGVVFANDSGNSACDWLPFVAELAGRERRVVVFEYGDRRVAAAELLAVAKALRAAGARRVALVGASLGGRAVVQVAARSRALIAAAVSLSAERSVGGLPDILSDARRVRVPSLYIGSREDAYTRSGRDTRQFHRVTPANASRMLLLAGDAHGVELLAYPRVRAAVIDFLNTHAR